MYNPQKLHPISYLAGVIDAIKQNIFLVIIFLVFNLKDFDFTNIRSYIFPGIVFIFFLFSFVTQVLKVYNTSYWIENDHFVLTTGIFTKARKELNIRRIQTLDTTQGVIHQLVGGVKLQIKTPSDGIDLDTVSKNQSELIQQAIKAKQQDLINTAEVSQQDDTLQGHDKTLETKGPQIIHLYKLKFKELLLMALTSGAIGVAFAALSPIIGGFSDVIPWEKITGQFAHISQAISVIIIMMIALVIVGSYAIGTLIVIIRNFNYTVTQQDNQLNIKYGLFNVKNITVPTDRVQSVVEKQSFLRNLFGYTSIHFVITSDMEDFDKDDVSLDGNVMILPFIKREKAFEIIKNLMPNMAFAPAKQGMPWRGFHRLFWRQALLLIIIASVVAYFWKPWIFLVVGLIIIVHIIHSLKVVKVSGFKIQNDELVVRNVTPFGFKNTYFKHDKILGMEIKKNPFLEKNNLANFNFIIAKGPSNDNIGLKYSNDSDVTALQSWYLGGNPHD
ncbi:MULTISPECIES: PH domain-containing protein [Staphylococcus]|uniref:PH domain-containing protein n=1 Tax=Staphylococcus TaxID=1279 RepID=UPI0008F4F2FF|nr:MULTISPECIES: PH domain-containing protein [Staphylococcus]MEB8125626.1 PH domain-containing protein [Staphylococcus succinus]OIJ29206.1 hypothetical protein BK821_11985 [Staphylococcus sp. LCT-H4]RIN23900.1 hypothetical protein BU067_11050 [Staphylococcus succinus]RIN43918.1 hypothetical protein BU059_05505 [Staphylococcus succinus]